MRKRQGIHQVRISQVAHLDHELNVVEPKKGRELAGNQAAGQGGGLLVAQGIIVCFLCRFATSKVSATAEMRLGGPLVQDPSLVPSQTKWKVLQMS